MRPILALGFIFCLGRCALPAQMPAPPAVHPPSHSTAAIETLQRALGRDPAHPRAWANLGNAQAARGQFAAAEASYRQALALAPGLAAARLNLALACLKNGEYAAAATEFQRYRQQFAPNDFRATLLQASCELNLKHYPRALALARRLLPAARRNPLLDYILAVASYGAGHIAAGNRWLRRLDRQSTGTGGAPGHAASPQVRRLLADAEGRLALQLLHAGHTTQALSRFQQAEALDPGSYDTNFYLGFLYRQRGGWSKAETYLRRALALRPRAASPRLQLGLLELTTGHPRQALPLLRYAARRQPLNVSLHAQLAQLYFRLRRPRQAAREQARLRRLLAQPSRPASTSTTAAKAQP